MSNYEITDWTSIIKIDTTKAKGKSDENEVILNRIADSISFRSKKYKKRSSLNMYRNYIKEVGENDYILTLPDDDGLYELPFYIISSDCIVCWFMVKWTNEGIEIR